MDIVKNRRGAWWLILILPTAVGLWAFFFGFRVPRRAFEFDEKIPRRESPEQTKQFLARVELQIQQLHPGMSELDQSKLTAISAEVYQRAILHPELREVWITAASVIDKRSKQNSNVTACGLEPFTTAQHASPDSFENVSIVSFQDCVLSLDGDEFVTTRVRRAAAKNPKNTMMELDNVHVVYRGGALPPFTTLSCVGCTFDVQLQDSPPLRGRSFVRGLLMSDFTNFSVGISSD
jgi:hypothetical protein